jgi:hypothetical protein
MDWYGTNIYTKEKRHIIACHVFWRELCYYAALAPQVFQFHFLKQGLHCVPDTLRTELQRAIDTVEEDHLNGGQDGVRENVDAILVGYGLCSNGLVGIQARTLPLVVPRGHDCITLLLGSKERYREYFDAHPGTYWYSPGWIDTSTQPSKERYERVLAHYVETYGEENAQYLMEASENWMTAYNTAAYVDLGIGDTERYKAYTRECAEWLNWKCDFLQGDPGLLRRFLEGPWDDNDFLVVQPGETIVASFDERVITTEGRR